jgi:hypothetical protein
MYNDFSHINEFGRMDKSGKMRPVHNINLIFTGETLYHIPTYNKAHPMRMDAIQCTASPLSDEQKMKHIVNTLKADFHISGEKGEQFENIVHYGVHPAEAGLEIAEIWGWVAEGAVAVTALQLTVAVLTPIVVGLSILNALDTDKRIVGRQAICYTVASWAFGTGIP